MIGTALSDLKMNESTASPAWFGGNDTAHHGSCHRNLTRGHCENESVENLESYLAELQEKVAGEKQHLDNALKVRCRNALAFFPGVLCG